MQSSGTLTELSLEGILDSVQKDRATGTLNIRSSDGEATLYFLFGHLFHATDSSAEQGEPVVHRALGWATGDFTFDAKAKLPAEETIKVSTAELLANRPGAVSSNGSGPATEEPSSPTSGSTEGEADEPASVGAPPPPADLAPPSPVAEAPAAPPGEPATVAAAAAEDGPRRRRTDQRPGTRPPETMMLYPVPLGEPLHEGLTAGFVDFPKLLRSLAKDGHSGYVRLSGEGFIGVMLFASGAVVEAIFDTTGKVDTGDAAFAMFGSHIDSGEGSLDVIQLTAEMVTGIFQLLTAPSLYERLMARFIKVDALLEYLAEQGTSGAVVVRGGGGRTGIVLYRQGELLGAYTDDSRDAATDARKVVALCEDPSAEIEVRGGSVPETLPVMEAAADGKRTQVPSGSRSRTAASATPTAPSSALTEAPDAPGIPPAAATEAVEEAEGGAQAATAEAPTEGSWSEAINEMAGRADTILGTRAKKVKELLFASGHDREEVNATIDRIAELSIMFVDPSKLSSLADEFRQIAARQG